MRVHRETAAEIAKRKSAIPEALIPEICENLENNLRTACQGSLAKVYIDEDMKRVALPLQENTSMGGVGVLPKGTRLPIPEGKKIRAFTYWELVDDIDLSVFAILKDGRREEFSWRTMSARQSSAVTFSGDQTSGYYGGSEYFDIDIDKFKELFPDAEYLVFCNNVFSNSRFSKCFCKCISTAAFLASYDICVTHTIGFDTAHKTADDLFVSDNIFKIHAMSPRFLQKAKNT